MPRRFFTIGIDGRINRRDLLNKIEDGEVRIRENLMVVGSGKEKLNRKVPGSKRYTTVDTGDYYISGYRYYTKKDARKTFAFNNGLIYSVAESGAVTADTNPFSVTAIPSWEIMRVSDTDFLYFSEGVNTGMFSHDGNIGNTWKKETAVTLNLVGMLSWLDRMWGFEEDSEDLNFSANLVPTNFTDSTDAGTITIAAKRGSKIMAIALLYDSLYILKQDAIFRIRGRTPAEFEVVEVHPYLGLGARRAWANTDSGIIFLGSNMEFYFFGGTLDSTILLSYKTAINGDLTKSLAPMINANKAQNFVASYHNNIFRCSMTETGQTTNNIEWCFNTINETDFVTRGFNISCYIRFDRSPDKGELLTGRTDIGHLMLHNQGLNTDNNAAAPSMQVRLLTKSVGSDEPRNIRFKRAWFNVGVVNNDPIPCYYHLDARNLRSSAGSDNWTAIGETRKTTGNLTIPTQDAISSRVNLDYGKAKGQSIAFEIDHLANGFDFELQSIGIEAIVKPTRKLSEKVGV